MAKFWLVTILLAGLLAVNLAHWDDDDGWNDVEDSSMEGGGEGEGEEGYEDDCDDCDETDDDDDESDEEEEEEEEEEEKIYIIRIGSNYGSMNFIDSEGAITGWGPEMVKAVCEAAGIKCRFAYAPASVCLSENSATYTGPPTLGSGLANGFFHACYGWFPTGPRNNVALFSHGFFKQETYRLWYIDPPRVRINQLRIATVPGPGTEICLRSLLEKAGVVLDNFERQVKFEASTAAAFDNLGTVHDMVFDNVRDIAYAGVPVNMLNIYDLDMEDESNSPNDIRYCTKGPSGIMVRPDSIDLVNAFNTGLRSIKDSGKFDEICNDPRWDLSDSHSIWHVPLCKYD